MNKPVYGAQQKALNYAFLLLKFRLRSEKELCNRLKKKKFDAEVIKNTLAFLKEKAFIDDNYFAKAWIEWRIKKPLGIRRLKEELKLKGIDKEIIDSQIQKIKETYIEEDLVSELAQKKLGLLKGIYPYKAKQRVYAYLIRRGFSPDVVIDVITQMRT